MKKKIALILAVTLFAPAVMTLSRSAKAYNDLAIGDSMGGGTYHHHRHHKKKATTTTTTGTPTTPPEATKPAPEKTPAKAPEPMK